MQQLSQITLAAGAENSVWMWSEAAGFELTAVQDAALQGGSFPHKQMFVRYDNKGAGRFLDV